MIEDKDWNWGMTMETQIEQLLAEVKRLREENDELHAQRVKFLWIQEARGGLSDKPLLLAEAKRLREGIVDMIDSMDNHYIRDIQHATDCLRDMIGYYEDEEE
jgi:hypothetical protein|tara:strand:+ start:1765 stop:2073 length:309 start_codon:yes stop_codon:yes gene_type:complete